MQHLVERALTLQTLNKDVENENSLDTIGHIMNLDNDTKRYFQNLFPNDTTLQWLGGYIIAQIIYGSNQPMTTRVSLKQAEQFKQREPFSGNLNFIQNNDIITHVILL